jgi:hypothetical protein
MTSKYSTPVNLNGSQTQRHDDTAHVRRVLHSQNVLFTSFIARRQCHRVTTRISGLEHRKSTDLIAKRVRDVKGLVRQPTSRGKPYHSTERATDWPAEQI